MGITGLFKFLDNHGLIERIDIKKFKGQAKYYLKQIRKHLHSHDDTMNSLEIDKIVDDKEKKVFAIFDKKKKEIKEKKKQVKLLSE